jgi:hypothetical protein
MHPPRSDGPRDDSLDGSTEDALASGSIEQAREEEIRRRLAEIAAGTAMLVPTEAVFAELRNRPRR